MTADAIFLTAIFAASTGTFIGGWHLRGLVDRYRAETERDRSQDEAHPPAADRGG